MSRKCILRTVIVCAIGMSASIAAAQETVTLTSTADFEKGNNEGLISTALDQVARDVITAGTVGAWSATTALPSVRMAHTSVAYNGFVYTIGGFGANLAYLSDVLVAPLNADGSVGPWTATTALPSARARHGSVAYNGFLYAIGGFDSNTNPIGDVLVASINADGTVGAWASTTALPSGRVYHTSVAYNGFVYVIGGYNGSSSLSDVLVAPVNADGTVGAWSTTTALPSVRAAHSSVAYNGSVYVIGGSVTSDAISQSTNAVLVAPLFADGTVGTWSTSTPLPAGRLLHASVAHDGFLYAIGGFTGTETEPSYIAYSAVLVTPLNADGTVGAWSATTALSSARGWLTSVLHNGFVYAIGGASGILSGASAEVLDAPIDADTGNMNQTPARLRGYYSHLVDLQSDTSTRFIILNGQASPGGSVRLQVRLAEDATGVFGSETVVDPAPLGSAVPGAGRYVWIRLTLDDTQTTDVAQPTTISDITVSPIAPPTAGIVNDGTGADIDTQTSTTTIHANWSGFSAASGDPIASYEWAIGSAFGLTDIQAWTEVGLVTSASNSSLSLTVGTTYYFQVRAISDLGLTSQASSTDGVKVAPPSDGGGGG
ncbi:MAG: hypothetical protein HY716_07075, partial [Planctomycetes bacterium]|nr:hypothetical protein [Planctomycetota bacterium]